MKDIQVFLNFTNFYWKFIKESSKIIALLTSLIWTTPGSTTTIVKSFDKAHDNKVDGGSRVVGDRTEKSDKDVGATITKNLINFLSPKVLAVFIRLQDAFIEAWIFHQFDPKDYI